MSTFGLVNFLCSNKSPFSGLSLFLRQRTRRRITCVTKNAVHTTQYSAETENRKNIIVFAINDLPDDERKLEFGREPFLAQDNGLVSAPDVMKILESHPKNHWYLQHSISICKSSRGDGSITKRGKFHTSLLTKTFLTRRNVKVL